MKQPSLHDDAFSGIEAAIIFIAFIVVASVFTYIMLGTGFFTTQVSQKVVNAEVQGAASKVLVVGDIYGLSSAPSLGIDMVQFGVTISSGKTPFDLRGGQMIISTEGLLESLKYTSGPANPGEWNISRPGGANNNGILTNTEIWTIYARPTGVIQAGTQFTLEVKPPGGASFSIRRTVPQGLDSINILY
ncbi:MAG: archaellin/type IV pilin N-terminal domain-containing protein [Methanomicrobiales archaeon]